MAGSKREREIARAKYERQQARRAASAARARRRAQIGAAVVAVLVVFGGVFALSRTVDSDDTSNAAQTDPTPSATPTAAKPNGDCSYTKAPEVGQESKFVGLPEETADTTGSYTAKISTNQGEIGVEFLADRAPCTVNSFRFLAEQGFYDGTQCHRLVAGAEGILQCGDPSATGRGGPGYSFADENLAEATYPRGTVAMANSGPDTNGSQFFLVFRASAFPPSYTPFGRITSGLDILDTVAKGGVQGEAPKTKVVIEDVVVSKG